MRAGATGCSAWSPKRRATRTFAASKNAAVMEHSRKSPTGCLEYTSAARRGFAKGPWSVLVHRERAKHDLPPDARFGQEQLHQRR